MTVTGTNNINVEWSHREADIIGAYNIPTMCAIGSPVPGTIYVPLDYFYGPSSSGTTSGGNLTSDTSPIQSGG